eukprot:366207-Chlamydomonas_euryale.AAC.9
MARQGRLPAMEVGLQPNSPQRVQLPGSCRVHGWKPRVAMEAAAAAAAAALAAAQTALSQPGVPWTAKGARLTAKGVPGTAKAAATVQPRSKMCGDRERSRAGACALGRARLIPAYASVEIVWEPPVERSRGVLRAQGASKACVHAYF